MVLFEPQYQIDINGRNFRVDFMIKAQIKGEWVSLIRFTGSEIVANPYEVCLETIEYMKSMARKRTGKAVNQ